MIKPSLPSSPSLRYSRKDIYQALLAFPYHILNMNNTTHTTCIVRRIRAVCLTLTGEACCGTGRTSVTPEGWDGDAICSTTAPGGETIGSRMLGGCLATGEMSLGCLITPAARGFIGNTGAG